MNGARTAVVTATSPLQAKLLGESRALPAHTLTTYTPATNDVVAAVQLDGGLLLILGKTT